MISDTFREGAYPALTTPFDKDGKTVDYESIPLIVNKLLSLNAPGFYVCGTTGQWEFLTVEQRKDSFEFAAEAVKDSQKRAALIAHIGSKSIDESIKLGHHAIEHGAAALSAITPAFETLKEIIEYYTTLVTELKHPFLIYTYPGLTNIKLDISTLEELAKLKNVIGVKFTSEEFYFLKDIGESFPNWIRFFGKDESFACSLPTGVRHAIGSSYNFMGPLYNKMILNYVHGQNHVVEDLMTKAYDVMKNLKGLRDITGRKNAYHTGLRFAMEYLHGIKSGLHHTETTFHEHETVNLRKSLDKIKPYMQN